MAPPLLLLALVGPAGAGELEWRAALGAQLDADSHGIADAGVRGGDWSAQLLTDTLDLRWAPDRDRGRAWVALRGELGATGLFLSPWTDGAPDPSRALLSHAAGVQAGGLRYLPHGLYLGAQAELRWQAFGAMADTTIPVPAARPVGLADAIVGWWSPDASAWVRGGADGWLHHDEATVTPHAHFEGKAAAPWAVGPVVELRAGVAQGQDEVTTTRLGGLTPYVVPVAGAAWAEWRVEDYAALRLGLRGRTHLGDQGLLAVMPFADAAVAEGIVSSQPAGPWAVGFGLHGRWEQGRSHAEVAAGHAPWIERAEGVGRTSLYLLLGVDWGAGTRLWRPQEPTAGL
jgi:hypothetical protein